MPLCASAKFDFALPSFVLAFRLTSFSFELYIWHVGA